MDIFTTFFASIVAFLGGFVGYIFPSHAVEPIRQPVKVITAPAPVKETVIHKKVLPYGKVSLHVGETATFASSTITLLRVFDDSRCAEGVTCIWAGTVKAEIKNVAGGVASTTSVELGKTVVVGKESTTLTDVIPYPKKGVTISQKEYQVTLVQSRLEAR